MSLEYGKMDFAVSFSPLTAFPLDARSYFESYTAAAEAAATAVEVGTLGSKYYFGETVCVVENGAANMYIINPDGTLGEVGGKIDIDEKAFVLDENGVLSLLGFAEAAAGAQLVKNSDGTAAWVKPDTTTVEGLSTAVTALQESTKTIQEELDAVELVAEDLTDRVEALESTTGTLSTDMADVKGRLATVEGVAADNAEAITGINTTLGTKANAADVYTKNEADLAIEAAVVAADHLRRKIVDSVEAIDVDADDALLYIYMVSNGLEVDDNKYYEYIVLEAEDGTRSIERVGSWEVDLSGYVTTAVFDAELDKKVDKVDGYSLISAADLEKLAGIEAGAQVNKIETVASNFQIVGKELQLVSVEASKLSGLDSHSVITGINDSISGINTSLAEKAAAADLTALEGEVDAAVERIAANEGDISDINTALESKANVSALEALQTALGSATDRITANEGSITAINTTLESKADKSALEALQTSYNTLNTQVTTNTGNIATNTTAIGTLDTKVTNLESALNNYVLTSTYTADITAIREMLTWQDI